MATRSVTCEETIEVLVDYLDGSMDASTLAAFEAHFADCPPCLDFLKTYKTTIRVSQQCMQEEEIPSAVSDRIRSYLRAKCQGKKPGNTEI
jgi:anti-sigma factor (TIGR02949 family)